MKKIDLYFENKEKDLVLKNYELKNFTIILLFTMFLFVWHVLRKLMTLKQEKKKSNMSKRKSAFQKVQTYGELAKIGLTEPFLTDLSNALGNEVDVAHIQPNSLFKAYFDPKSDEFKNLNM